VWREERGERREERGERREERACACIRILLYIHTLDI
jgi:hypothetical protein